MQETLGMRIAQLRREKQLKQDELAQMLNVSAQAVSKWENDLTCPDISCLPQLAEILGVTVDELLSGKKEPTVKMVPLEERKPLEEMMLRIVMDSAEGDKVRVNLPLSLVQAAVDMGIQMPQLAGNASLQGIDLQQILQLVSQGAMGNFVEVDSADGDTVRIFVE